MGQITITAKRNGFMRCGVAHKDSPVVWEDGAFTDAQIAELKAEPMLVVYDGAQAPQGQLEDGLKQLQDENDELSSRVDNLMIKVATQQATISTLTEEKDALQKQLDTLSADKSTMQGQLESLTGEKAALQKQLDELNSSGGKSK